MAQNVLYQLRFEKVTTTKLVSILTFDLKSVVQKDVVGLIDKLGIMDAARILGYDTNHYDNLQLAGRLLIHDLHQKTPQTVVAYAEAMKHHLNRNVYGFICDHADDLQAAIDKLWGYDFNHDWFSAHTMINLYAARTAYDGEVIETPQYTYLRVATQLYFDEGVQRVIRCLTEISTGLYSPASPTLFNAGMIRPQMSSCFLLSIEDNTESIVYRGWGDAAMISKASGGLGVDISRVRHSEIGKHGMSKGIIPILITFNDAIRCINQSGRRKGAATVFLRPHHIDVFDFVSLVDKVGDRYERAHDINTALWVPWIFWKRVREDGMWTMFCPAKTIQLNDVYGEEFERLYIEAENDPTIKPKKIVRARELYAHIRNMQRKTGMPYIMHADACNMKSNQRHLGYIRGSNLCLEIIEYTDEDTIASCNLHSISLRAFAKGPMVTSVTTAYDFTGLAATTRAAVQNINKIIDLNWYPLDKMKKSDGSLKKGVIHKANVKHRPTAVGVQGFAEALHVLDLPFEDPRVKVLNECIFACMYFNALIESVQLAIRHGPHESFRGSPFSHGKLQFDLWHEEFLVKGANPLRKEEDDIPLSPSSWNQCPVDLMSDDGTYILDTVKPSWDDLKRVVMKYGTRNSLLLALMPTASTAQIMRNCETTEAHQSNLYSRKVLKGSYPVINRYLVWDLEAIGVWNSHAAVFLQANSGSVKNLTAYVRQNRDKFPNFNKDWNRLAFLERKYKTMWELPQSLFLDLSARRSRYIDQSSSLNIYFADPTDEKIDALHLRTDLLGLKTGMYYLRQNPPVSTIQFSVDPEISKYVKTSLLTAEPGADDKPKVVCDGEYCIACQ